jgi:hypothetical protein
VSQWSSFEASDLEYLEEQGVVQYEKGESHTVQSFLRRFRQWRDQVSTINGKNLTPELLLMSWPNTDNHDFVNCVKGWHAAGGERLAVIYDPADDQASVPGPFVKEVPGKNWCKMKDVLNDREGGIKR